MSVIFLASDFELVPCPVCGGKKFTSLADEDRYLMGMKTVGCESCGFVFTNPQPTELALGRFYKEHYRTFYQKVSTPDADYISAYKKDVRSQVTARFLIEQGVLGEKSCVLDIGAAEGSMLKAIADVFPDTVCTAVEPNPDFGKFAQSYACCEVYADLSEVAGRSFDLIILNHVLEHVKNPVPFLGELAKLLTSDGRLYIDVPSVAAYNGLHDLHVAHLYHFGTVSLRNLLLHAGFSVQLLEAHSPVMHPRSLRLIASVGTIEVPVVSATVREGWDACREAGNDAWRHRLRATFLGRLLVRLKVVLKQLFKG